MTTILERPALLRRGLLLEYLTVGWNIVEGIIALAAGFVAGSPALIGFLVKEGIEALRGEHHDA